MRNAARAPKTLLSFIAETAARFAEITAISETEITLKELVEDQSGEWAERISTLQLQEQAPQEAKK